MSSDQRLVQRFLREMAILSKLRHEHIVRYYGGGKDKTQHFYAMEFMDGGSIEHVLKKKGRFSWEETIDYARQIAFALEYSHNHGIIHRDLKPANLFLGKDGRLKLGDFGIARDTQATALTAAGRTVGTYAYMAPEQISGKPPVSRKTDLYALGCVMFEMLTGKPPFIAPTAAEMLFAHLEQEPPRITGQALDCPVWLENLVLKLLEKDPEERYYDALALQVALDEVGQKVAAAQSVAQQTVAGGGSGATVKDDAALRQAAHRKKEKEKKEEGPRFTNGSGSWPAAWLVVAGLITWFSWPLSDEQLFAQAQKLMESKDSSDWDKAREKLSGQALEAVSQRTACRPGRGITSTRSTWTCAEGQATIDAKFNRNRVGGGAAVHRCLAVRTIQGPDHGPAEIPQHGRASSRTGRRTAPTSTWPEKKSTRSKSSGGQQGDVVSLVNDNLKRADELGHERTACRSGKNLERSHHSVRCQQGTEAAGQVRAGPPPGREGGAHRVRNPQTAGQRRRAERRRNHERRNRRTADGDPAGGGQPDGGPPGDRRPQKGPRSAPSHLADGRRRKRPSSCTAADGSPVRRGRT